ncbi:MAG: hypothetical protein ACRDHF_10235 [Tepidiformaceae bacterium]
MFWLGGFTQVVARITAALLASATALGLIYSAVSRHSVRWWDWAAVAVASVAIMGTGWSLVFLEYKGTMMVEPDEGGGPSDLRNFHQTLTSRYRTKTKGAPNFDSGRLEYLFARGERQFYYHLAKGITEVANAPKVKFSIQ